MELDFPETVFIELLFCLCGISEMGFSGVALMRSCFLLKLFGGFFVWVYFSKCLHWESIVLSWLYPVVTMPPNLAVFSSTRSQEYYDVNLYYVGDFYNLLQPASDAIGSMFADRTRRTYVYGGVASILAVLRLLWPGVEDGSISAWQEFYMYQNSYAVDPPDSATMHTRHSDSPEQWFQATVHDMVTGPQFYATFWDFVITPLYDVTSRSFNHAVYKSLCVEHFVGIQEWLWPVCGAFGPHTMRKLRGMMARSWRSGNKAYKVPMRFMSILRALTRFYQPRVRM